MSSIVAILGRPNVGKSTLFNALTKTKKALVKNQPGVTRDINTGLVQWSIPCSTDLNESGSKIIDFEIIDTGGLTSKQDGFSSLIQNHIQQLMPSTACLIVVVDAKAGLCPEDIDVVRFAQKTNKPFLIVANKVDKIQDWPTLQSEFYSLGQQVFPATFEQRQGLSEILDWIIPHVSNLQKPFTVHKPILSIVGRPNVGKSSLCNRLHGLERMLVTDIPGTTTDSIDSIITYQGKSYTLIDTAGMRRKSKREKDDIEVLASYKAQQAMNRADVILLLIDGMDGPSQQDARLVEIALKFHKPVILVVNKTDLGVKQIKTFRQTCRSDIKKQFHFFSDIPIVFISAKTGLGLDALFAKVENIWEKLHFRISTSQLNQFVLKTVTQTPAPLTGLTPVKFYYLTQTQQVPPSFIAFVNQVKGVTPSYKRFLIRKIKENWKLTGIPIRIFALKNK